MTEHIPVRDYAERNRRRWNDDAVNWVAMGEKGWRTSSPAWGEWAIPESEIRLLPEDMAGMQAIELGCGTAYVSAWMARRGAQVIGIDISDEQLRTAKRLRSEHALDLELIHGNAETVPMPDGAFDFAISEYGAALWANPHVWVQEAWRVLREGGRLVFLTTHPFVTTCYPLDGSPATYSLHRPYFGMHQFDWTDVDYDPGGVEFNLTIGDWFALLTNTGFQVERFLELQCPVDRSDRSFAVSAAWARRYPSELVWVANKT